MISIGAGQAWARGGDVYVNTGTVEGGTLTFYKTYKDNMIDNNITLAMRGEPVYIEATPDVVHTVEGMTATNFTVVKSGGTNIAQARRRSGSNNPSAGVTITVTQVMDGETPIPGVFCFTMPDDGANVFVSATFPDKDCAENVAYIDKNGEEQSVAKAYILTGSETVLGVDGHETWYVCNSSLSYPSELTLKGDVNLIIAAGRTMTVPSISGDNGDDDYDLAIYGQAPANGDYLPGNCKLISDNGLEDFDRFTVNSGYVNAGTGIDASNITINGGQVNSGGMLYASSITLGWSNANDYITASSYSGTVKTAEGKILKYTDGDNKTVKLMGDISATDLAAIPSKKLTPYGIGGYCGQNLTWDIPLVEDALSTTMTIEGTGDMTDYTNSDTPWKDYTVNLILVADEDAYNAYAQKLSDDDKALLAPVVITLAKNTSGWSTYCHNYPVCYRMSDGNDGDNAPNAYTVNGLTTDGKNVKTVAATDNLVAPAMPLLLNYNAPDDNDVTDDEAITLTANLDQTATPATTAIVNNGGTGWTFYGNAGNTLFTDDGETKYVHTIEEYDGTQSYVLRGGIFLKIDKDEGIAAHRCWLNVTPPTGEASARLVIAFDTTGMSEELIVKSEEFAVATGWYDMQGRKLDGKPTKKGLYIHNGVKTVIK